MWICQFRRLHSFSWLRHQRWICRSQSQYLFPCLIQFLFPCLIQFLFRFLCLGQFLFPCLIQFHFPPNQIVQQVPPLSDSNLTRIHHLNLLELSFPLQPQDPEIQCPLTPLRLPPKSRPKIPHCPKLSALNSFQCQRIRERARSQQHRLLHATKVSPQIFSCSLA